MKSERAIVRNRPGSGGPDDGGDVGAEFCGFTACAADERELYPDAGAGVIFVFDFSFGERGGIVDAPVDRFAAAINVALFDEVEKGVGDGGLVLVAHREVGIVPAAKDAETLKVALVLLDVTRGKFAAEAAEFGGRNFAFAAELFFDLRFDGEAVAIPAGDVRGVMAGHGLGFDDEVFENFVEASAEMDGARGIGRAIVKNEKGFALARSENGFVKIGVLPSGELLGLVLRQAGFHGKVSFAEIEGLFEFTWWGHIGARANPLFTFVFPK